MALVVFNRYTGAAPELSISPRLAALTNRVVVMSAYALGARKGGSISDYVDHKVLPYLKVTCEYDVIVTNKGHYVVFYLDEHSDLLDERERMFWRKYIGAWNAMRQDPHTHSEFHTMEEDWQAVADAVFEQHDELVRQGGELIAKQQIRAAQKAANSKKQAA